MLSRKAVVAGAGPVGCLAAMALARSGWQVDIYEGRADMRLPSSRAAANARSINLAISARGLAALHAIDPAATQRFLGTVIPMRGRMIHSTDGRLHDQAYDTDGQCINSIDRALLNEGLLDEASAVPNIRVFFKHKIQAVDFDRKSMVVRDTDENKDVLIHFDFCVGADGSYSVVRRQMMRVVRMDFQQEYIPHEYLELKVPAGADAQGRPTFLLDPNHLHIWPRHSFMLIALPNKDKSFTCTLFAPTTEFGRLRSREAVLAWFAAQFPDALALIGADAIADAFAHNPLSPLISTKCNPYHYKDRVIILGDAAHSMVPFYGQGLNCGLEDVRVLDTLLREEGVAASADDNLDATVPEDTVDPRLARALARYSASRHEDLIAICDMAMDNYVEMRHSVTTPVYLFRKMLDNVLFSLSSRKHGSAARAGPLNPLLARVAFPGAPRGWLPLYTMVTFRPDISYATARRKAERQAQIVVAAGWVGAAALGLASVVLTSMALAHRMRR
ncbi:hypothetical protein HWV62_17549 [Athelia sp. TMB]|nr:hypothetical protein HWV62_17549 [Athelia sp. TMB]